MALRATKGDEDGPRNRTPTVREGVFNGSGSSSGQAVRPLSAEQAMEWIEQLIAFPCQAIDHRLVRIAIEQSARYRISYWDAAILSAATAMGCHTLYSEDLNDGQEYEDMRVVNPFKKFAG